MAWYLNRALTNFRNEVNARWPRRDKASDGTIGDLAHSKTSSDHNPDSDGSVDAWDMDVDGVDVRECIRAFEAHESSKYWIYNDQICFRSEGWEPRSYAYVGPNRNRHTKHVHFNTRGSHEDSTKPWFGDWMPNDDDFRRLEAKVDSIKTITNVAGYRVEALLSDKETYANQLGDPKNPMSTNRVHTRLDALEAKIDALAAVPPGTVVIPDEQFERVLRKVVGSVDGVS